MADNGKVTPQVRGLELLDSKAVGLVLSRQKDQKVMIGDDTKLTIVDIRGDKVRLGIFAPTERAVHRAEVYQEIQLESQGWVSAHVLYKQESDKVPRDITGLAKRHQALNFQDLSPVPYEEWPGVYSTSVNWLKENRRQIPGFVRACQRLDYVIATRTEGL